MSRADNKAATDMTEAMEETMQRLQGRFQAVSEQLESKNGIFHALVGKELWRYNSLSFIREDICEYDEMGTRINDLEKNVAELMTQAGMEKPTVSK